MDKNGRKVIYAKFHTNLFLGALGDMGVTFPPTGAKTIDVDMTHTDAGLHIKAIRRSSIVEFLVPWANVVIAQYDLPSASTLKAVSNG